MAEPSEITSVANGVHPDNLALLEPLGKVEVKFNDTEHVDLGWATTDAYLAAVGEEQGYECAGYWIGHVNGQAVVAGAIDRANGTISNVFSIPIGAIRSIRIVGVDRSELR